MNITISGHLLTCVLSDGTHQVYNMNQCLGVFEGEYRSVYVQGDTWVYPNYFQLWLSFLGGRDLHILMGTIGNQVTWTNDAAGLALASAAVSAAL